MTHNHSFMPPEDPDAAMYLLILEGEGSFDPVIYHWFHPGKTTRDMRPHLFKQLGPRAFLMKVDPFSTILLRWAQLKYGKEHLVIYKVDDPINMREEP